MGESRGELLAWLNDLLQLQLTKMLINDKQIEQCGTGFPYCQIIDSIFGDVQMSKVKTNAKQEYEYLNNFKVLQTAFKNHGIDKPIPVERLVKCKMQDNLEFCQWMKKYWDLNYPGGEYDALARRKGQGAPPAVAAPPTATRSAPIASVRSSSSASAPRRPPPSSSAGAPRVASVRAGSAAGSASASNAAMEALRGQMEEMKLSVDGLEKERDFYFNKLRDIEIEIGTRLEMADDELGPTERDALLKMQQILYATEDGFEVPDVVEGEVLGDPDEETF